MNRYLVSAFLVAAIVQGFFFVSAKVRCLCIAKILGSYQNLYVSVMNEQCCLGIVRHIFCFVLARVKPVFVSVAYILQSTLIREVL